MSNDNFTAEQVAEFLNVTLPFVETLTNNSTLIAEANGTYNAMLVAGFKQYRKQLGKVALRRLVEDSQEMGLY